MALHRCAAAEDYLFTVFTISVSLSLSLSLFLVEWIRLREEEEECVRNVVHSRIVANIVAQKGI